MSETFNNDPFGAEAGEPDADRNFLAVGIGASAGGIQALKEFFERVPAESGMAYVVILHLSPDHDSQLAQVLQSTARIPVTQVARRIRVEPNHVYVIPPNKNLEIKDGHIDVLNVTSTEVRRAPVDIFFRTLAESHGARAVSVVLSGTGANGSMGMKRVKEKGGLCIVQDPQEAEYDDMPRHSLATNLVDYVLPVAEIPAQIIAYREQLKLIRLPDPPPLPTGAETNALRDIFTQLRVRTGHDFSNYKRQTVMRRIARRMGVHELPDLVAYSQFMHERPAEATALLKDLLISVTNFFRDAEAFDALEHDIVPKLFEGKTADDQVRVWVPGCATGEEPYTVTMLLSDYAATLSSPPQIQVFATDIDEAAIATARDGYYTLNDAADVSPERLARYFTSEAGEGYRVRREIRERVLFAVHNVIKDPPFAHLDLATCRNFLIYLNRTAQRRVMDVLHFALNAGGYLMLGSSETVDGASDLYSVVDKEHRIYQGRAVETRLLFPVPDGSLATRLGKLPEIRRTRDSQPAQRTTYAQLHQRLLEHYAPPSVVVNEDYDILHMSESAGSFMYVKGGDPSTNLLMLVRPELRLELRAALYQAAQKKTDVESRGVPFRAGDVTKAIRLRVRPVLSEEDRARGFFLVLFEEAGEAAQEAGRILALAVTNDDEPLARRLEEELLEVRAQMNATLEQHELQREELKAANEELQAMNEELRAAAEELETSKEELQSINEELITVNQELKVKIEELGHTYDDLRNLMNSTQIGTVFLDRALRVKLFTLRARDIFNLIPADAGRHLSDITSKLDDDRLIADAERVLERLEPVERVVRTKGGHAFLMQISPYRTAEDRINGVVVTFLDITGRERAEEAVRESEEKYRTLFNSIDEGFLLMELLTDDAGKAVDIRYLEANPAIERQTGLSNLAGKLASEVVPGTELSWLENISEVVRTGESVRFENYTRDIERWYSVYASRAGGDGSRQVVCVFDDITERKRRERNLAFLADIEKRFASLTSSEEIAKIAGALIGEHFNVSHCLLVDINEQMTVASAFHDHRATADFPSLIGDYELKNFHSAAEIEQLAAGQSVVINDVFGERNPPEIGANFDRLGTRALVTAPYVRDGRWKFAIGAQVNQPREWRADETEFLTELATRVALRLERARAEEALRESEAQLAIELADTQQLQRVSSQMIEEDNTDALYQEILEAACSLMRSDFASIQMLVPERKELLLLAHAGFAPESAEHWKWVSMSETISCGLAMTGDQRIIVPDAEQWDLVAGTEDLAHYRLSGIRAMQCTRLVSRNGRLVGMISTHWRDVHEPAERELRLFDVLARQTADVIERRGAEEALRQTEQTFSTLIENAPFGVYLIDAEFRLRTVNEGSRKVFSGIEPLIGRDFAEIMHTLWQEPFATETIERFRHTLKTGESFVSPPIIEKRANIEEIESYDWQIHRVLLPDGSYGVVCYFYDLSEQKRLEETVRRAAEALRDSEERLRLTTESVTDYAIFTTDTAGSITSWNVGAERIFGFTEKEAIGQHAAIIFTPEDRAKGVPEKEMKTARETGRASDERWHVRKDGSRFYVSGVQAPLRDDDRLTGYVKIARDMTEQQRAEEALRRAHDELEARVRERTFELAQANETLRGEISERIQTERDRVRLLRQIVRAQEDERRRIARDIHDQLGQQMTALRLNLDSLDQGCGDDAEMRRKLEQAKTIAERLDADVDFLAWELRPAALDDIGLAEALGKFVREWSKHSGVEAQFHTTGMDKERLPSETETNLYRITQEALNNTMKYARARRVDVLLERRDHQVVLIVEDDGVGFDPAKEAFADGDKGMGLIGMRERAVLVGGSLEIESKPKKGTTIFARVPVRLEEEKAGEAK
jgi:PAS domain S-box-containing protein